LEIRQLCVLPLTVQNVTKSLENKRNLALINLKEMLSWIKEREGAYLGTILIRINFSSEEF
jgi:hypothetical protein